MTAALTKKCGIYKIRVRRHDGPDRFYIGQSAHIFKRWNRHLAELRTKSHWNLGLQIDFEKYGESAFSFEVMIVCEPKKDILTLYEQAAVDSIDADLLYNIRVKCVVSGLGTKASPERCLMISKALTGIKRSDETKAAIGRAQAWKRTPEGRAKQRAAQSLAAKNRPPMSTEQRAHRSRTTHFLNLGAESYAKAAATRALNKAVLEKSTAWVLF